MPPQQQHYRPYIHHAHPQIDIDQQLQQKQMMAQQQQQRSIQQQRRRTPEDPPSSSSRIKSAEVPKIELSSRQQQLQQQLQRLSPPKKSNHPSHSALTRTYQEPWEKPFVLQQEARPTAPPARTMISTNPRVPKNVRSDPPTTNVHRPHPTTTTASSSSSAVQMDSQRAFLRSFLQKKHPVAHQTHGSERSAASSTSPSALLQRVLHQTRSPKEKSNAVPPTSTTLQEKMRQRFQNQKGASSTGSSSHPTVRTDAKPRPVARADLPKRTTTPKSLPSGKEDGYDGFVESLMKEVSAHHSQLYASFLAAIDPHVVRDQVLQECLASPRQKNKVDKDTIQRLHSYVQKQPNGADACRPVSQLVNDKQYKALSPRHMKKKANPVKFKLPLEELSPPPPSKRMPSDTKPAPPSALEKLRSILKPTLKSPVVAHSLQKPKSRAPNAKSINDDDDPVLNTRSMDSSSTTETAPFKALKKPQLSVQIPSIRSTDSSDGASSVASSRSHTVSSASMKHSPAWKGLQLRSVASVSSAPSPLPESSVHAFSAATGNSSQQPEWATITLRPVSVAERSVVTIPPTAVSSHNEAPPEQMTMEEVRNAESSIVLGLKSLQPNHRISKVVIGPTQIRQIEYENESSSLVHVIWTIRKDDMEPDGMTLNMPTLKVTLILRPGHLFKYKILCFESPEECLRFATAFYHRSAGEETVTTQPIEVTSSPPVEEIPDLASLSSDVNSSVRMTESILSEEEQVVLERYRELRQTKPATDAMHETLSKESEVSTLAEASTLILPKVVATSDLPSSPVSTFTTTTVGDIKMDAEPPLIERFQLMLQRGVPPDAVRHKMTMEQVDDKIMAQVLGDPATMTTTSTAESAETNLNTTVVSNLSAEDDEVAEKYRKMLKMGIPADGVRHKMILEQVDAKIVVAVLGMEATTVAPTKTEAPPALATRDRDIRQVLSEEEESVASQYRKLLKINVSKDALLSRMKQEGVSPKIIMAILGSGVLSSLEDGTKAVSNGSNGSKLIPINWDLTENAMAGSVWEVWQNAPDPEPMDFTQLKQIFQRKERNAMKQDMKHESSHGNGKAKLLDITRSNNIAISLKAFKEFSHAELAESIRFLDPMRKIRGERTNFIRDLLPTVVEMKIVDEYAGPDDRLVPAELWFRHLKGIPRLQRKARVLRTMEMFTSDATEVRDNFRLLLQVCRQVMASVKLQDVLGMVLRIGNVMNEGTRNGRAAGFKFNSLLRLTQTKTADGKITVLDYLVSLFVEKGESDKLDLLSDFPDCHKASRFLISDMNNEVKLLKESLHQCKLELSDLERDQCPPPKEKETGGGTDARAQLFASIQARGVASKDDVPVKRANEAFTKRDEFLAAIQNSKKDSTSNDIPVSDSDSVESKKRGTTSKPIENTLAGGILRLRNFVEVVDESFQRLEKQRDETLEACKDLSRYCGESGGVGVTISLLDVLSQFAKNLEDAHKKYHEQQQNEARKLKVQEAKDTRTVSTSSGTTDSAGVKTEGTSIVVLVNDMLKNANPRFKEDFKKGRVVPNPSQTLKVIYEHEQQSKPSAKSATLRLDIVSAIQQRGSDADDADELAKARSTFAGVVPDEDSSPRELAIDQTSSFPPTNIHSPVSEGSPDETDMADIASNAAMNESPPPMLSVKERAMLFHHPSEKTKNIEPNVKERPNPLLVAASPSKENIGDNGTPRKEGRRWGMEDSEEEPMIDLTRSRERLSQSRRSASPLLDVVKQSLEQRTHITNTSSAGTASPPPRVPERRKSLTERAREKRWDKHRVGSIDAGLLEESPTQPLDSAAATESAMARMARQKRLQKRLSR